jgi:hypothetical protein
MHLQFMQFLYLSSAAAATAKCQLKKDDSLHSLSACVQV